MSARPLLQRVQVEERRVVRVAGVGRRAVQARRWRRAPWRDASAGAIGSHPMDTLTPAEVAQLLGTSPNRVRQLLRDRKLMAVPGSGNGKIPADFVQDGVILKHLPGLLTVLKDGGFTDEEAFDWLFRADDSLPGTPRAGAARRPAHRGHPPGPGRGVLAGRPMGHLTYLGLLAGCLVVTAPLELVLRRAGLRPLAAVPARRAARVRRVRRRGCSTRSRRGTGTTTATSILGVRLPGGIPVEEVLFFLVVPLCAVLAFEAVRKVTGWRVGDEVDET